MTPLQQTFLTSALTLTGGIILLVAGQVMIRFFIEPIHEQRKLIGEISDALIYYANLYSSPGVGSQDKCDEASRVLRQKASLLRARTHAIPWYGLFTRLRIVKPRKSIETAASNLTGLSNSIHRGDPRTNHERRERISDSLGLAIYE